MTLLSASEGLPGPSSGVYEGGNGARYPATVALLMVCDQVVFSPYQSTAMCLDSFDGGGRREVKGKGMKMRCLLLGRGSWFLDGYARFGYMPAEEHAV